MDDRNKNKPKRPALPRNEIKKDGVIYTPSAYRDQAPAPPRRTPPRPSPRRLPAKRRNQKSQFAVFLIAIVFLGSVVTVAAFAVALNSFMAAAPTQTPPPMAKETPTPIIDPSLTNTNVKQNVMTAVILSTNSQDRVELYDVEQGKTYWFYSDETTELKDKYGAAMAYAEFYVGDIVEATFENAGNTLKSMRISPSAFTHKSITNVKVNPETEEITIGNDVYRYNFKLISHYKGTEYSINGLDPLDTVTVRGYRDHIWYINITNGHGTLVVEPREDIIDPRIEIDMTDRGAIEADAEFKLTEGSHKAIVTGSNSILYVHNFAIENGKIYFMDLEEIQLTGGRLTVNVNEPDATVRIDGTLISVSDPVRLRFGDYLLTAEKDGFLPHEQLVEFWEPSMSVSVTMEAAPTPTPEPTPSPTPEPTPTPIPTPSPTPSPSPTPVPPEEPKGTLTVSTTPSESDIYIDNQYVGKAPLTLSATLGNHTITIRKEGYIATSFIVTITGKNSPLAINLQPVDSVMTDDLPPGTPIIE